jgi:hypothetical protein
MPHFDGSNVRRIESLKWMTENKDRFQKEMTGARQSAAQQHQAESARLSEQIKAPRQGDGHPSGGQA